MKSRFELCHTVNLKVILSEFSWVNITIDSLLINQAK